MTRPSSGQPPQLSSCDSAIFRPATSACPSRQQVVRIPTGQSQVCLFPKLPTQPHAQQQCAWRCWRRGRARKRFLTQAQLARTSSQGMQGGEPALLGHSGTHTCPRCAVPTTQSYCAQARARLFVSPLQQPHHPILCMCTLHADCVIVCTPGTLLTRIVHMQDAGHITSLQCTCKPPQEMPHMPRRTHGSRRSVAALMIVSARVEYVLKMRDWCAPENSRRCTRCRPALPMRRWPLPHSPGAASAPGFRLDTCA